MAGLICFPIIDGILKMINDKANIIINAKMFFCEKYSLAIFHQFLEDYQHSPLNCPDSVL
jgi:hypothetical protein